MSLSDLENLALAHAPPDARTEFCQFLQFDSHLSQLLAKSTEPMLGQIRLSWWRERLAEPAANWPQGDPVLEGLSAWGEGVRELASVVDAWELLLGESLGQQEITGFAEGRAKGFLVLAHRLGVVEQDSVILAHARLWALSDLAHRLSDDQERQQVLADTLPLCQESLPRLPKLLKPLAILSALGRRALRDGVREPLSKRGDALIALRIGMLGR